MLPLLGLGCAICGREEAWVEVSPGADGGYQAEFCGHFQLAVSGDDLFRARILLLFLRLLEVPGQQRGSRRTRDGRTPFLRQAQIAPWFGLTRPYVSRLERDWQRADWANLLSQRLPEEVLTADLTDRIVTVCATFPHWTRAQVYQHLREEGRAVSQRQVRQAMGRSGWTQLRRTLQQRCDWSPVSLSPSEQWLVQELLQQIQNLLVCLEQGQPLPEEERLALRDLQTLAQELGVEEKAPLKTYPWLLRVQRVVLGQWEDVIDETICCPDCGSTQIGRKSRQGRMKKFYNEAGELQEVEVFRYYCRNQGCPRKTFTHFPPGLVPYSRHRLEVHLLALQAYEWGYSTYRRVGQTLQVSEMTVYRWVSAWGQQLLPVAAIFGLVRSSGVVGVDEKHVLVPKNDKPAGKNRRWMYVYLAVDAHTLDLLHIALYPHNTKQSAQAFLLALRTKGYHPRVVVTDLRRDYGSVISQVFPQSRHHECIFHAEQELGRYLRETWGRDYAEKHPEVETLRQAVVAIFRARSKRTARKRYQALLDQQEELLQAEAQLQWGFDFLAQHWPTLLNAVESTVIPRTNNAVEMVIRRFDQHYQNFCGFESLQSAQVYLGVFEKIYRFTPFSDDAQPAIRGKSPLQLAGYDVSQMPMPWLCRGYSLEWPVTMEAADVPSS
jgi:transposase-like protein